MAENPLERLLRIIGPTVAKAGELAFPIEKGGIRQEYVPKNKPGGISDLPPLDSTAPFSRRMFGSKWEGGLDFANPRVQSLINLPKAKDGYVVTQKPDPKPFEGGTD